MYSNGRRKTVEHVSTFIKWASAVYSVAVFQRVCSAFLANFLASNSLCVGVVMKFKFFILGLLFYIVNVYIAKDSGCSLKMRYNSSFEGL